MSQSVPFCLAPLRKQARLLRQQQEREAKAKRRAEEEEAWRRLPELQAELARTRDELSRSNKRFVDLEAARRSYAENLSNALRDKNAEAAKAAKEAASARKVRNSSITASHCSLGCAQ